MRPAHRQVRHRQEEATVHTQAHRRGGSRLNEQLLQLQVGALRGSGIRPKTPHHCAHLQVKSQESLHLPTLAPGSRWCTQVDSADIEC